MPKEIRNSHRDARYFGDTCPLGPDADPPELAAFESACPFVSWPTNIKQRTTTTTRPVYGLRMASSDALAHGRGQLEVSSRVVYRGTFRHGYPWGAGRGFTYHSRSGVGHVTAGVFRGDWRFGVPHGFGETVFFDGSRHVGTYFGGRESGVGVHADALGGRFVGTWLEGERHGSGKLYAAGGECAWNVVYAHGKRVACAPVLGTAPLPIEEALLREQSSLPSGRDYELCENGSTFEHWPRALVPDTLAGRPSEPQPLRPVQITGALATAATSATAPPPSSSSSSSSLSLLPRSKSTGPASPRGSGSTSPRAPSPAAATAASGVARFSDESKRLCQEAKERLAKWSMFPKLDERTFTQSPAADAACDFALMMNGRHSIGAVAECVERMGDDEMASRELARISSVMIKNNPQAKELGVKLMGGAGKKMLIIESNFDQNVGINSKQLEEKLGMLL